VIGYKDLVDILKTKDKKRFLYTIEFFPEEGKYHWDGHSTCRASLSPKEAIKNKNLCRVCGKPLTIGVAHRLEGLADRPEGFVLKSSPPFKSVVGLFQIISDVLGVGAGSKKVQKAYFDILQKFSTEMEVLIYAPEDEVRAKCSAEIAQGIINVRKGDLKITPGYDGEYGKVKVLK
jgi:PHP family Zn ribbon phosphoesterase